MINIWYIIYNMILLPIMVIIGTIGVFFNKKIKEGFFGRFTSNRLLDDFINSLGKSNHTIYYLEWML